MNIEFAREVDLVEDNSVKLGHGSKGSKPVSFFEDIGLEFESQIFEIGEAPGVVGEGVFIILVLQKTADVVEVLE